MKPPRMVPLHVAVDKFATKRALDSLEPPAEIANDELIREEMIRNDAVNRLPSLISKAAQEIFRPALNRQRLFEHLSMRIARGELVAYGIRTKPSLGLDLELVPSFLFRNSEWDVQHDAIENAGHRFELIEVGRLPRAAVEKPIEVRQQKKMGRPTKEVEIEEVVRKVLADTSAPRNRKALCDRVREAAVTLGKSVDSGYSDSTIKRLIVRVEAQILGSKVQ
jgi:HEAT repeat protein